MQVVSLKMSLRSHLTFYVFLIFAFLAVEASEVVPCGNLTSRYPKMEAQQSAAPYVLNVSDGNGDFNSRRDPIYGIEAIHKVRLSGLNTSMNSTDTFTAFLIYAKNEFADEESGHFEAPFPSGVSKLECTYIQTSQMIEFVTNSTGNNEWSTIEIKWKSPKKHPAGKITISAIVLKEPGVFWEGISVTLGYVCSGPRCANRCPHGYAETKFGCTTCTCADACAGPQCANRCPNGYAKTKFGCTTCTCAGAGGMGASLYLLLLMVTPLSYLFM